MDRVHCNRLWSLAIAIGMAAGIPSEVAAQTFPSKTLRIIVPFPPGGAADVLCRVLAENMSKQA